MERPGPTAIERRYAELIRDICAAIERGQPPWWNETARLGPAVLGRSGQCLRGLPAVIAWHVSEHNGARSGRRLLAWRLRPADQVEVAGAAVFQLPANGGSALYTAIPDRRPRQVVDAPTRPEAEFWPLDGLTGRLDEILTKVADLSPPGCADRPAIASLAQAFIRPLGDARLPTPVALDGAWTHARLARVAAWARLLADDVRREAHAPKNAIKLVWVRPPHEKPSFSNPPPVDNLSMKLGDELCHSNWLQHCQPAEVRQPSAADDSDKVSDRRYLVPEQPLRSGLFHTKPLWRAPALGRLMVLQFVDDLPRSLFLSSLMVNTQWRDKAALGLALAESMGQSPVSSEPAMAWRFIGRIARDIMQRGRRRNSSASEQKLLDALMHRLMYQEWVKFSAHHVTRTWFHPTSGTYVANLVDTGRWRREDISVFLDKLHLPDLSEGGAAIQVKNLPVVKLATLRRPKKPVVKDERTFLGGLAEILGCEAHWSAVSNSIRQSSWERHKRSKRSGGIRWLDIPSEPLRTAQRKVSNLLLSVTPCQGTPTAFHPGASPALHACAHIGAIAAVRMDLVDFFGSVRPWHLEPWLGLGRGQNRNLLPEWSAGGRKALLSSLFLHRGGTVRLPQGAPSSPAAANLAGLWLDQSIVKHAKKYFGADKFVYTRYADDMVLSTCYESNFDGFLPRAQDLVLDAVAAQKWQVQKSKTRMWTHLDSEPLQLCGIRVPMNPTTPLSLDRPTWRRARAALHRLRHRIDFDRNTPGRPTASHGLLSYCYSATADLRWLAYTSRRLQALAAKMAGPLFSESFLAGWSDSEVVATTSREAVP